MEIKLLFTSLAIVIILASYIPYFRDIFSGRTKPHAYTWLIWTLTQGTAAFAIWYGGGGFAALYLGLALFPVFTTFVLSIFYGTKNITRSDFIILVLALFAILLWWQLSRPLISVIMVSLIDFSGYIPSFRKSFSEPWSETLIFWLMAIISNLLAIFALNEYNLLTLLYLATITSANILLILICFFRRFYIRKPRSFK